MKVALYEIVDGLEMQFEEQLQVLDRQTGQVEVLPREVIALAEEDGDIDELPEWEQPLFELAKERIVDPDRFVRLPTKYDVDEWEIMREFAESVAPRPFSEELQNAIRGSGAFRYFKDTLRRYGREKEWYAYKTAALRDIAIDWCEENGIEWEDRPRTLEAG